jgi:hypothetical protein
MSERDDLDGLEERLTEVGDALQAMGTQMPTPPPSRFWAVAVGLSEWSTAERAQINASVVLSGMEERVRAALASRRSPAAASAEHEKPRSLVLRLAARECRPKQLDVTQTTAERVSVRLFEHSQEGWTSIQLLAPLPHGCVRVRIGAKQLELIDEFDRFGIAVVRTADVVRVIAGDEQLSITGDVDRE